MIEDQFSGGIARKFGAEEVKPDDDLRAKLRNLIHGKVSCSSTVLARCKVSPMQTELVTFIREYMATDGVLFFRINHNRAAGGYHFLQLNPLSGGEVPYGLSVFNSVKRGGVHSMRDDLLAALKDGVDFIFLDREVANYRELTACIEGEDRLKNFECMSLANLATLYVSIHVDNKISALNPDIRDTLGDIRRIVKDFEECLVSIEHICLASRVPVSKLIAVTYGKIQNELLSKDNIPLIGKTNGLNFSPDGIAPGDITSLVLPVRRLMDVFDGLEAEERYMYGYRTPKMVAQLSLNYEEVIGVTRITLKEKVVEEYRCE